MWPHDKTDEISQLVAVSDVVVFVSPACKPAYTGLLKASLDRHENDGLRGVVAVPVMTAASATSLRLVFGELRPYVPSHGLCFDFPQMASLDAVVNEWAERSVGPLHHYWVR